MSSVSLSHCLPAWHRVVLKAIIHSFPREAFLNECFALILPANRYLTLELSLLAQAQNKNKRFDWDWDWDAYMIHD